MVAHKEVFLSPLFQALRGFIYVKGVNIPRCYLGTMPKAQVFVKINLRFAVPSAVFLFPYQHHAFLHQYCYIFLKNERNNSIFCEHQTLGAIFSQ
jgi:hypothetical protein